MQYLFRSLQLQTIPPPTLTFESSSVPEYSVKWKRHHWGESEVWHRELSNPPRWGVSPPPSYEPLLIYGYAAHTCSFISQANIYLWCCLGLASARTTSKYRRTSRLNLQAWQLFSWLVNLIFYLIYLCHFWQVELCLLQRVPRPESLSPCLDPAAIDHSTKQLIIKFM